jgi:hypothetical protein
MYLFESVKFCLAADQRSNDQKGVLHFINQHFVGSIQMPVVDKQQFQD